MTPWSYSSRPKLAVIERCAGRSLGGDGRWSVSSGPMPRLVASLRVSRWFGEGLRHWRRPSRASSATPRTRVTGGTAYAGGAPPPPSTVPPTSPTSFGGGGRWRRLATAPEYALGYSDRAVVGALELPWPVGVQAADGGLVVLLADLWGDAMYSKSVRSTSSAASTVLVPVRAGPTLFLADMDVAEAEKEMDDARSDSDSTAVSSTLSSLESSRRLPGVHRLPPPQPLHRSPSPQSSHHDSNLRPRLKGSGRGVPRHLFRPREWVRHVELTPTH